MNLFDASPLIEAKNRYYSFDICPAFWEWLILENQRGNAGSIQWIRSELKDPDLLAWVTANPQFFAAETLAHFARLTDVSEWVMGQSRYTDAARADFLGKPDATLIAFALEEGHTVVTQEKPAPRARKGVKIPDVCAGLGVACRDTFQVLHDLRPRFILAGA